MAACAARAVDSLDMLQLSDREETREDLRSRLDDLNRCRTLFPGDESVPFFGTSFDLDFWVPVLPESSALAESDEDALLLSALRGRGIPLSYRTDREAVEWAFSVLLSRGAGDSCEPLHRFVSRIREAMLTGEHVHLAVLCDLAECFSAASALVLLPWLRSQFSTGTEWDLTLIALADTVSPLPQQFMPDLAASLDALCSRSLLRIRDDEIPAGADAMWLVSLPSSMCDQPDAYRLPALAAGRALSSVFTAGRMPVPGLHVLSVPGTLSLHSLDEEARPFAAFLVMSCWLLSDLIPSLRGWLGQSRRRFALSANSRPGLFRRLFPRGGAEDASSSLDLLERTLRRTLADVVRSLETIPAPLRYSADTEKLWKQATDALGRYVTVASEYDVIRREVHESGMDTVRPVHRESLTDTEEEKLLRRIGEIGAQMDDEQKKLVQALEDVGPFRAAQARADCLARCRTALASAREKLSGMSPDTEEHIVLARQERRIRLLEAAAERCESGIEAASLPVSDKVFPERPALPADGIMPSAALSALKSCLTGDGSEAAGRALQGQLSALLENASLPDPRSMFRSLLQAARCVEPESGLPGFLLSVWRVCSDAAAGIRPLSRGNLPDVPLLPDLIPSVPVIRIESLLSLIPGQDAPDETAGDLRGLLAMLILRQYRRRRPEEAKLAVTPLSASTPLLRAWLSAQGSDSVRILSLTVPDADAQPFALVLPGRKVIPAHRTAAHTLLVPAFAYWFNRSSGRFSDPDPYLSEGDRRLLLTRMAEMIPLLADRRGTSALGQFFSAWTEDLNRPVPQDPDDPDLAVRIQAVCGLHALPAYGDSLQKVSSFYEHFLSEDPVAASLTGLEDFPASSCSDIPDDVLYLWRGIPFARENPRALLSPTRAPEEKYILSVLSSECATLTGISDDFRDALQAGIPELLSRFPDALEENRSKARKLLEEAVRPLPDRVPELVWPWDPLSPSVKTVLRECMDDTLADAAAQPFPDRLLLFPARGGEIIGDSMLSGMCSVFHESAGPDPSPVPPDALIPPFSPAFAAALSRSASGRVLLTSDLVRVERADAASLRVSITLDGRFTMRLVRTYTEEEIITLYSHDIPTMALWPSVPFPSDLWHAYFVYASAPDAFGISVWLDGSPVPVSLSGTGRRTAVCTSFPVCFDFSWDGVTAGSLPNILPRPMVPESGPVTACVDFGSVCTSVIFSDGAKRSPLNGPVMVRTLLNNPSASYALLRREFLPSVPVTALLPTVTRIFRNVPGAQPEPFADGIILMSSDLNDILSTPSGAVYTCLKWEEEKGRSGFLCLHQVMLMAALQARLDGASSLSWRFALPDEMAPEGREYLAGLFRTIALRVGEESGFANNSAMLLSFASESTALGAYFRCCAPDDTRGGFMVLDIGACTADISLFLWGREQAVRSCQLPMGVHYMLLPGLLEDPYLLQKEFGGIQDEMFAGDLNLLVQALCAAGTDPVALRRTRIALDHFIADHGSLLLSAMLQMASGGYVTRFGAVLLLRFCYLMMLSGLVLLQIAADPNKNDFLPEQMSLCLAGRGASLLEMLPENLKGTLWSFLTMFRNRRVASMSLLFSAEKKLEIPVGLSLLQTVSADLPPAASVPAALSVRPEELLPEFLLRFRRYFPGSAELLFPSFFTNDYYHPFSPWGESLVTAAITQSFSGRDPARPYGSLSSFLTNLLDIIRNHSTPQ